MAKNETVPGNRNFGKNYFIFEYFEEDLIENNKRKRKTVEFTSKLDSGNCLKIE